MKVRELREKYSPEDIVIDHVERPRASGNIHSPTTASQHAEARRNGKSGVSSVGMETIIWETPLDEKVFWLTGMSGEAKFQAGNTMVVFEVKK